MDRTLMEEKTSSSTTRSLEDEAVLDESVAAPHLQFAPNILSRLGEELVPHADQGLLELAKNAYDADATTFTITLSNTDEKGGTVTVSDNGRGMGRDAIENGWLILGASSKQGELTPIYKRVPAGNKGLGRLAALRLGGAATLKTRPIAEPGIEYEIAIRWDAFNDVRVVEDVAIPIIQRQTSMPSGSEIEITGLRKPLTASDMQRLSRNLLLMSDPFGGKNSFKIILSSPEFEEIERKVRNAYFGDAVYRLRAECFIDGTAVFETFDWKGERIWNELITGKYETVPAVFELWLFLLDGNTFSTRKSTVKEVRNWLKVAGGVHIYENGIRVAPYGGADADWLELNLMRVASPEERPSTNNVIGRVNIMQNDGLLHQKTDRVGYIENEAFTELKRFGQDALKWLAQKRLKVAEARRNRDKQNASEESRKASADLDEVINKAASSIDKKKEIERAVEKVLTASEREKKALREDLQLYRSLATAGMTSAVFSHEISHPINHVAQLLSVIDSKTPPPWRDMLVRPIEALRKAKDRLLAYTRLPLKLLRSEKRRVGVLDIHQVIRNVSDDYMPVLENAKISLEFDFASGKPAALGSAALIEGVFANFFANSVKAFDRIGTPPAERLIRIRTEFHGNDLRIIFSDSGPGISGIDISDIWLPGKTTDESDLGTGFGLTIVRDSVLDLGGSVAAKSKGELGGAEFIVNIPLVSAEK